jgi:hypothetical protein
MVDNPFELLNKSQRLALSVAGEAFDTLLSVGRTATQPEEAVRQLTTLISAVGELASATVQPLQDFIGRQRELADTMANLATMQAELAELVETLAHKHAAIVESLENLTAPVFGLVAKQETADPAPASKPRARKK